MVAKNLTNFNRNYYNNVNNTMHHSSSHASSARKKLLQFQQTIKREQSQSGYLGRTLSREHSKMMQSILRQGLQKEDSGRQFNRQHSASKEYKSNLAPISKSPSIQASKLKTPSSSSRLDIQLSSSLNTSAFKPLKISQSISNNKYEQIRIDTNDDNSQLQQFTKANNQHIPHYYNDTDEIRSARQNQLMEVKKKPFVFSFPCYIVEVLIGYGVFLGIMFLTKLSSSFPYFEILFILALTISIHPWRISTILLPLTALAITIINTYLNISSLTYIQVLACYIGIMAFNEKYKIKFVFILVLVLQLIVGLFLLPNLYKLMNFKPEIYYYIFPVFIFLLRNLYNLGYWVVGYSQGLFLQVPLFIVGLEYGTILAISVGEVEFWYLIVCFTLQVINDRTHFILKAMVRMMQFCYPTINTNNTSLTPTTTPSITPRNNHLLPAHSNGFTSIHSFHLIACVYLTTTLPISATPYTSSFRLSMYLSNGQWYKPLIIWGLISVYEIMCIVLERKRENIMLIGYTTNKWWAVLSRGVTLALGLWMFYMGLGVAGYSVQSVI